MVTDAIIEFLLSVGLKVYKRPISESTFLPGIKLHNGALEIDTEKLLYPGDILHEAGHLATMPPTVREIMSDQLDNNDLNRGGEMMAIAWSYAVCKHLSINPQLVFHPDGYRGGGESILQNFEEGRYIGLPLLQWAGMAYDEQRAKELNKPTYPEMIRWLREI